MINKKLFLIASIILISKIDTVAQNRIQGSELWVCLPSTNNGKEITIKLNQNQRTDSLEIDRWAEGSITFKSNGGSLTIENPTEQQFKLTVQPSETIEITFEQRTELWVRFW